MSRFSAIAGVLDFFVPAEVLSAVLLVFTMENVLDYLFSTYVPPDLQGAGWIAIYAVGVLAISGLNYLTADEDEREDLGDDLDQL